jgi:hypothetical protein
LAESKVEKDFQKNPPKKKLAIITTGLGEFFQANLKILHHPFITLCSCRSSANKRHTHPLLFDMGSHKPNHHQPYSRWIALTLICLSQLTTLTLAGSEIIGQSNQPLIYQPSLTYHLP